MRFLACLSAMFALFAASDSALADEGCEGVAPVPGTGVETVQLAKLPSDSRPLFVDQPPGERERYFIVDQNGRIFLWKAGSARDDVSVFLDIRDRVSTVGVEMGLLGLAFDPDYATSGEFYVNYTGLFGQVVTRVSRFSVDPGSPDLVDPSTEEILLRINQPDTNHNGGQVQFGPDGFLYVSTGDGGSGNDPWGACGNGQNEGNLLGALLRLDVRGLDPEGRAPQCSDGATGYTIPSDNPYVDTPSACGEVYASGLRNPWRSSFDAETGDFWAGDVGQICWEEVSWVASGALAGANFGWRQMEGKQCFDPASPSNCNPDPVECGDSPSCNDPSLTIPVLDYASSGGNCSVTGGYVYRGCRMPDLAGTYFYGDYCSGFVRTFRLENGQPVDERDLTEDLFGPEGPPVNSLTSFGQGATRELYLVIREGELHRIVPLFSATEVSGTGSSEPFLLGPDAWTWEDLARSEFREIKTYRVYRGVPNGVFHCIHETKEPSWEGDPLLPEPASLFAYLVTAEDRFGVENDPGGPAGARDLDASGCALP